jgi:hypothetical protein
MDYFETCKINKRCIVKHSTVKTTVLLRQTHNSYIIQTTESQYVLSTSSHHQVCLN